MGLISAKNGSKCPKNDQNQPKIGQKVRKIYENGSKLSFSEI